MRRVGILGGIGPESTVDYYRQILARIRELEPEAGQPTILINSIDMPQMLRLAGERRLAELTDFLAAELGHLAAAGADFAVLASNTPHLVFDELQAVAALPLLSIVEAASRGAQARGLQRLGLLGTRFTMQGEFYPRVFRAAGLEVVAPTETEQVFVHDRYMNELVPGIFSTETRAAFRDLIARMSEREQLDGLILAGTELPLLLRDEAASAVPLLDTTRLHVDEIVAQMRA